MKIAFRVDASLMIGTGHVMRCLTLADALTAEGSECHFICREHPGNLLNVIEARGHHVYRLPMVSAFCSDKTGEPLLAHSHWLGSDWYTDVQQSQQYLQGLKADWLVVDHYGLDRRWEQQLRADCGRLMVIDDLADRAHDCDLLLAQTYGREASAYKAEVPDHCKLLIGAQYALLRSEFAALREYSLERRVPPKLRQLLITMGGVDKDNTTGNLLAALQPGSLPDDCRITVVMGATAPWLASVKEQADALPWAVKVEVNVSEMARLMADSDLAIGAAGGTSWERATVGLPSLLVVTAVNQKLVAESMVDAGAVESINTLLLKNPLIVASKISELMANYSERVGINAAICDGRGASRVAGQVLSNKIRTSNRVWLRDAVLGDCELVYSWQMQPEVRKYARNAAIPLWSEHQAWYANKMRTKGGVFKIIMSEQEPIGVIRLDPCFQQQVYEVSVYIAVEHSGRGFASQALAMLDQQYPSIDIMATVLPENYASHALFRKSGYTQLDETTYIKSANIRNG